MSVSMPITAPENISPSNREIERYGDDLKKKATFKTSLLSFSVALYLCVSFAVPAFCSDDPLIDADRASTIDFILERAMARKLISGGVVLVGNHNSILYSTSRGSIGIDPSSSPLTTETLFDIASLTKVVATAPAIMKLMEDGVLSLMDPITRWFPELEGSGHEETTILNLLTHTSGLQDVSINSPTPMGTLLAKAAQQDDSQASGRRFLYADINFILLAELVQRASGVPFDRYCREKLYFPLGMHTTCFLPRKHSQSIIAPTIASKSSFNFGTVQDENAQILGGVAGHAGLFSNATELSRFAMMILNSGTNDGKSVFSRRVMTQMTAPYFYNNGKVIRGLGWDIQSPYSSPRGNSFSDMSFGHTGYSGSSLWIDPKLNLFVLVLTIRLDYHDKRRFNRFRSDISTLASTLFAPTHLTTELLETGVSSELLKP